MYRFIMLSFITIFLSGVAIAQQMSDSQVVEYVKDAYSRGQNQNQIIMELAMRGVSRQQVERIQTQYVNTDVNANANANIQNTSIGTTNRSFSETTYNSIVTPLLPVMDPTTISKLGKHIFGHDIFANQYLTFEPNLNQATPDNYILGPGDEVIIHVWGASENTMQTRISPQGNIQVEHFGPISLSGLTIKEANNYLQRELGKIYSGVSGNVSQIKLTLGEPRTIQINIMGEVLVPGTYRLSAFSSVFHAIYATGGVIKTGSLRNIQVIRKGEKIADVDIYKYIFDGKIDDNIRLMEGDVIIVPTYNCLVQISGNVKKPMYYEMKTGETIDVLLSYTGGFTGDAYRKNLQLTRSSNGREKQIYTIEEADYSTFKLQDGDDLTIQDVLDRYENRVTIRGAVYRGGVFAINEKITTVKQLIEAAEGLRGDAFLDRAQLQRQHEDLTLEIIPIDINEIINNTIPDIPLLRNDELYIPSIFDLSEKKTLTIHGEIGNPGTYEYADNITVEDLIVKAGGLLEAASSIRVDITRRIKDPKGKTPSNTIGIMLSLEMQDGLIITKNNNSFILQPYDEVYIRRSPAYQQQQNVTITGEVLFGGNYALTKKNERVSDLIKQAGGITPDAYIKGARLFRQMTEQEKRQKTDIMRLARATLGEVNIQSIDDIDMHTVGIDLEKALQQPGSNYDLILKEGDRIDVPEYINTVKINGAVMYPNTISYKEEEKLKYYIEQAGGYGELARKNRVYVIYMNGTVARIKKYAKNMIEPGCEIVIPSKNPKREMTTFEYVSLGTSLTTLVTMLATMISVLR
ncbi:capsule polysaccharide transporter [termite gut metagenome]|uniref:Capsule polysaccharide transporter n=1 Tax=termite gut metagenome TaxID=433724 RepID=A0A5J4SL17_9ZZZZ